MKATNKKVQKIISVIICLALVMSYAPMASIIASAADDHICVDNDEDHWCDICDELAPCVDENDDCKCDYCSSSIMCKDNNLDHFCDTCGTRTHLDGNSDQKCDVCGKCVIICFDEDITLTADASGNKYFNGTKYTGELIIYHPGIRGFSRLYITIESGEHTVILHKSKISNLTIKSGAKLNLTIEGVCDITGNLRKLDTAVKVEENAELLITGASTGTLTASGGYNDGLFAGGMVTIEGGNIEFSTRGDKRTYFSGVAVTGELIITGGNISFKSDYGAAVSGDTVTDVANSMKLDPKKCCGFGIKETEASEEIIGSFNSLTSIEELVSGDKYKSLYIYELEHTFQNGLCVKCDRGYEPAKLNSNGYYEIANAGNLFWFARQVNELGKREVKGILTADIDLEERPWTPIGTTGETNYNFRGVFDGQGHTITGLNVTGKKSGVGFFGEVRNGTVENFTIYGEVKLNAKYDYVGGVIGSASGVNSDKPDHNGATIRNITSYVNVTLGEGTHGANRVGGFMGYANHETLIENCSWYGTLDLGPYRAQDGVGGLVGKTNDNSEVTIRNCASYGTIKTSYQSGSYNNGTTTFDTIYIGGIVSNSVASAKTTIENTVWAGTIVNETNLGAKAHISAYGSLNGIGSITNCYALDSAPYITTNSAHDYYITIVTEEQLASGKVAYKLGSEWGQKLGTDTLPVVGGEKLYYIKDNCPEYTNISTPKAHSEYKNGFCIDCGGYQPAELVNGVYQIANAGNLFWFARLVNIEGETSANAALVADIDLEGRKWYPIGLYQDAAEDIGDPIEQIYNGTFEGNGHTVSNFVSIGNGSQGLIGYTSIAVTIKNLGIINATVSGWNAGAVLAYFGTVENCYALNCTITAYTTAADAWAVAGGAIAGTQIATVKNSFAKDCKVIAGEGMSEKALLAPIGGLSTENCYYTNVTVTNGTFRESSQEIQVAKEAFESGEVAYRLGSGWGQMSNVEGSIPVPTDNELYKVVTVGSGYSVANVGDTNSDGKVDSLDYQALVNEILAGDNKQIEASGYDDIIRYDLDGDGYLDVIDAAIMQNFINGHTDVKVYPVGDVNKNGKALEEADINAIKTLVESPEKLSTEQKYIADINRDGKSDRADLAELSRIFEGIYHFTCEFTLDIHYSWADDYSTCTATAICNVCNEVFATEEVNSTHKVLVEKSCTQNGETKHTATFKNEIFDAQEKLIIENGGHVLTAFKDNGDGTHSKSCIECNYTETAWQYHTFDDNGSCLCGFTATPISTYEELEEAALKGGVFALTDDIHVGSENIAIKFISSVTLHMNGKTIIGEYNTLLVDGHNTLTLYGEGTIATENSWVANAITFIGSTVGNINGTTISGPIGMYGNTFNFNDGYATLIDGQVGTCNITGGRVDDLNYSSCNFVITGGTFSNDVSEYLDTEKYIVKKNADGTYTVIANES